MKTIFVTIVLVTSILAAERREKASPRNSLPTVYLLYTGPEGTVFDRNCAGWLKTKIDPQRVAETARRTAEFQALWDKEGPRYLSATFNEIGVKFPFREMQAVLTVCPVVDSMSTPLLINVTPFLSDAQKPLPLWFLSETVFHELMHTYVRQINDVSALRKKYQTEPLVTLNHLHVMALEKFALTKLGEPERLKYLDQLINTVAPPTYKRAWEIVNVEGYEAFVAELKQLRQ
jgi:hypothetical protein